MPRAHQTVLRRRQGRNRPTARPLPSPYLLRRSAARTAASLSHISASRNLRITPVIVGDGLRLFPEKGPMHDLELVESRSTSSGVMIQTYRPNGRAVFGPAG